jgi:hypothetical protein
MYTYIISKGAGNSPIRKTLQTVSGESLDRVNVTIPSGTTNYLLNFSYNTGSGVYLGMTTNTTSYPLTLKTNSPSAPVNTIIVSRDNQQIFFNAINENLDFNNSTLKNINNLFITNTGTRAITLEIEALTKL